MSCKHPLKGFPVGVHPSGKPKYHITSYDIDHVEIDSQGHIKNAHTKQISPYSKKQIFNFQEIPCGKCMDCRLSYAKQWSDRCMMELQYHEHNYFVTLTYDDLHVPYSEYVDDDSGLITPMYTLLKEDVQLFMKRLRKRYSVLSDDKIRFYLAGEYGESTARPHYHMILFGCDIPDLKFYKETPLGDSLYTSDWLSRIWNKGHVVVGDVTPESCNYVARYITKKQYGSSAEYYDKYNILPEFTLMSRKPGIGRLFYDDNKEKISKFDFIPLSTESGGVKVFTPRYFDKLLESDDPVLYEKRKDIKRKFSDDFKAAKLEQTSKRYEDMLRTEEEVQLNRVKIFKRDSI